MPFHEDAETEDDVITNAKDLYKRFEVLVQKDPSKFEGYK